jgi:hypothetical protein
MKTKETAIKAYQEIYQAEKERVLIRCIKDLVRSLDDPTHISEVLAIFPDATKELVEENFVINRKGYFD